MHKAVWYIAIEEMLKAGDSCLSRNNFGLLDTIGILASHTRLAKLHPLNRHVAVLNALESSKRFRKSWLRMDRRTRVFTPLADVLAAVEKEMKEAGISYPVNQVSQGVWLSTDTPI